MLTKTRRDELEGLKNAALIAARDIAKKAEDENRDFSDEERVTVTKSVEDARGYQRQILEADGDAKLMEDINALGRPVGELAKGGGPGLGGSIAEALGDRFVENPEFKSWFARIAPTGTISESTKGWQSPALSFAMKEIYPGWARKAVVTGASPTSGGALQTPDWLGLLDGLSQFQRPMTVVDLVTKGTTGTDTVEYARVTGITNNAAFVPEATTGGAIPDPDAANTAGLKPESALALEKVTANVKTIAHWIPATKRALSDAGQIRTLIDQFLRYGLDEALEDSIVQGDGSGETFEGILEVDGTQHQAFDTDLLATARKAKTLVRTVGRARSTAYLLNPEDMERIDLLKDEMGRYYFGGPGSGSDNPLWGLPRVESEAVPQGTGIVADFKTCILWDREQASIQASDSHSDYFVRNLVAILAEMRAAFGIVRPLAICTFDIEGS